MPGGVESVTLAVSLGNCFGLEATIALAEVVQKCRPGERTNQSGREGTHSRKPR
jgi:hypothetical protein